MARFYACMGSEPVYTYEPSWRPLPVSAGDSTWTAGLMGRGEPTLVGRFGTSLGDAMGIIYEVNLVIPLLLQSKLSSICPLLREHKLRNVNAASIQLTPSTNWLLVPISIDAPFDGVGVYVAMSLAKVIAHICKVASGIKQRFYVFLILVLIPNRHAVNLRTILSPELDLLAIAIQVGPFTHFEITVLFMVVFIRLRHQRHEGWLPRVIFIQQEKTGADYGCNQRKSNPFCTPSCQIMRPIPCFSCISRMQWKWRSTAPCFGKRHSECSLSRIDKFGAGVHHLTNGRPTMWLDRVNNTKNTRRAAGLTRECDLPSQSAFQRIQAHSKDAPMASPPSTIAYTRIDSNQFRDHILIARSLNRLARQLLAGLFLEIATTQKGGSMT